MKDKIEIGLTGVSESVEFNSIFCYLEIMFEKSLKKLEKY